jgi:hypothetical protein
MSWKRRLILTVGSLSIGILLLAGLRLMHAEAQPTTPPIEPAKTADGLPPSMAVPPPVPAETVRALQRALQNPVRTYVCEEGVLTFAQVSKRLYDDGKYGAALSQFNRDNNVDIDALRSGQRILYPPAEVLVSKYAKLIGTADVPPLGGVAIQPVTPPASGSGNPTNVTAAPPPILDVTKPADDLIATHGKMNKLLEIAKQASADSPPRDDPSNPPVFDPSKPAAIDPAKPATIDPAKPPAFDPHSPPSVPPIGPSSKPSDPASPSVKTWDLNSYRCQGETSFAQVSQRLYGHEKYGRALWLFNRDCNPATDNLRGDAPRFEPGQSLIYPPAEVLAAKYASAIGHAEPETKTSVQEFYWTLQVDSVGAKTSLTAKAKNNDVVLNVVCDSLDLQSPRGKVVAQGNVKITGPHLTAKADKLTINFHDDSVMLEGQAEVKHKQNSRGLELKADRLALRVQSGETKVIQPTVNYEYEFVPRQVDYPRCP